MADSVACHASQVACSCMVACMAPNTAVDCQEARMRFYQSCPGLCNMHGCCRGRRARTQDHEDVLQRVEQHLRQEVVRDALVLGEPGQATEQGTMLLGATYLTERQGCRRQALDMLAARCAAGEVLAGWWCDSANKQLQKPLPPSGWG